MTIEVTKDGDLVRVETKYPKKSGGFWGGNSINVSVDYKVWVPETAAVELKSVSGDVDVAPDRREGQDRLRQRQRRPARRGRGRGQAGQRRSDPGEHRRGRVHQGRLREHQRDPDQGLARSPTTVSGDIRMTDVSGARTVDVKTVSGNVTYIGAIEADGRYELKTHSGDVRMSIPAGLGLRLRGQHLQRRHRQRLRDRGRPARSRRRRSAARSARAGRRSSSRASAATSTSRRSSRKIRNGGTAATPPTSLNTGDHVPIAIPRALDNSEMSIVSPI
ncbi:MAG: DUF4097 domain-containing protein [Marinilabiliales bacterium]|nr:DUF4097 domain-containing protein [Marinilabiliales bacterium]